MEIGLTLSSDPLPECLGICDLIGVVLLVDRDVSEWSHGPASKPENIAVL